ncbi:MAG: TPM domain-containing protein [Spirochaetia bacterium]|nr:TPM domain-containing protein [Spirochaetia bacterium]
MFKKKLILFSLAAFVLFFKTPVFSESLYPALTDRVVDEIGVLGNDGVQKLKRMLQDFEDKSGTQIVVAVLSDLRGYEISDYSVNLAREWKIGQKDKNNGILMLVAIKERKMRIEVGYGLEGQITDARSKYIIEHILKPQFRVGKYKEGLLRGAQTIIQILSDEQISEIDEAVAKSEPGADGHRDKHFSSMWFNIFIWIIILVIPLIRLFFGRNHYTGRGGFYGGGFSGGGFSGGGGGGFSGGGGSFGGGGASGSW